MQFLKKSYILGSNMSEVKFGIRVLLGSRRTFGCGKQRMYREQNHSKEMVPFVKSDREFMGHLIK